MASGADPAGSATPRRVVTGGKLKDDSKEANEGAFAIACPWRHAEDRRASGGLPSLAVDHVDSRDELLHAVDEVRKERIPRQAHQHFLGHDQDAFFSARAQAPERDAAHFAAAPLATVDGIVDGKRKR